jgi:hypothetical protein
MHDVFASYSVQDKTTAAAVCAKLAETAPARFLDAMRGPAAAENARS